MREQAPRESSTFLFYFLAITIVKNAGVYIGKLISVHCQCQRPDLLALYGLFQFDN